MAITLQSISDFVESTTSPLTSGLPASYTTGDMLIAYIVSREDNPTPVHGITTSAVSWTQIGSTRFLDIGTTGIALSVWYRFATSASETAPSVTCPTPNTLVSIIVAFQGVDQTTPLDGVTPLGGTNAAAASLQPNGGTGITTNTNGAEVVCIIATPDDNSISMTVANSFTNWSNQQSAANTDWSASLASRSVATAGNVTACTFTQNANGNDEWAWQLFALRPTVEVTSKGPIIVAPSQAVHRAANW